jgi:hypothetical protein
MFLPFDVWAMAALIGLSALAITLIGRPGVAVGVATAWLTLRMLHPEPRPATRRPLIRKR